MVHDRAIYRLANAMLLQAVQDAMSSSTGRRTSALRWMSSSDDSCYSFRFVCRLLHRDPEQVRRFCRRKAAERGVLRVQDNGAWRMPNMIFEERAAL
jgi:hypothetical protein